MSRIDKIEWRKVGLSTWAADVPGGTLIEHHVSTLASVRGDETWHISVVFVPDPPSTCPHGDTGVCMPCLTVAIRDGIIFGTSR